MFILAWSFPAAALVIQFGLAMYVFDQTLEEINSIFHDDKEVRQIASSFTLEIPWVLYLLVSKRVKNTFGN